MLETVLPLSLVDITIGPGIRPKPMEFFHYIDLAMVHLTTLFIFNLDHIVQ